MKPIFTHSQFAARINDTYSVARVCKSTDSALSARLDAIRAEVDSRTQSGARRYSVEMAGYVRGYIAACRDSLWRNDVEFCYKGADGKLYSTWRDSSHDTTETLHAMNLTSAQWDAMPRAHVWKGTDKPFTEWVSP